jgi:hypothetical protein
VHYSLFPIPAVLSRTSLLLLIEALFIDLIKTMVIMPSSNAMVTKTANDLRNISWSGKSLWLKNITARKKKSELTSITILFIIYHFLLVKVQTLYQ